MENRAANAGDRKPLRVIIIGAGAAGMAIAIKLLAQGFADISIYEKAQEVGGTWRENRYPGVACDVPSHHYAYTFEPMSDWQHRLAHGYELQRYMEHVSQKYDLRRFIRFGEEVATAHFDGDRWHITTRRGTTDTADAVVACCGYLHVPLVPDIPGLKDFRGQVFHSAQWPDSYDFSNKRVALVGNGSTGVQIASSLGDAGAQLTVLQRSAQWVFPLPNREIGATEQKLVRLLPWIGKLTGAFYQAFFERVFAVAVIRSGWQRKFLSAMCRINLKRIKDPALRQALTPDYQPLCRRMVMSWDFYRAIQRPNVRLLTSPIERIVAEGIRTQDGALTSIDTLVLATGFHAHNYIRPIELTSDRGARLSEEWAGGAKAYLGIHIPKFPNFFMIGGPSSPLGNFSATAFTEAIADRVLACVVAIRDKHIRRFEVSEEAQNSYYQWLARSMPGTIWVSGCRSWYLTKEGFPANNFPGTPGLFRQMLRNLDLSKFRIEYDEPERGPRHGRLSSLSA